MRRIVCLAAALAFVVWAGAARADQPPDMKALIDKAIKAAGGEAKLAKFQAGTYQAKGKFYGMGEGIDFTGSWAFMYPDKFRFRIESGAGDQKFTFVRVLNGNKLWMKMGDNTEEITDKAQIAEAKEQMYTERVGLLFPLKEKGYGLKPLGEVTIDGKSAIGVCVSHKGHRDLNLFFDKDKGLLVKMEAVVKDDMAPDKEFKQETFFSGYKEVNGLQLAMNVVINRDGKKYVDSKVTEFKVKENLPDSLFTKP